MTEELQKTLENEIEKILYLYEMKDFDSKLDSLFADKKITQLEYDSLLSTKKLQLKFILDLNLLPSYEFISHSLESESDQILVKVDPGEILVEEFEIIEREVMQLNLSRVSYIQTNFCEDSRPTSSLSKNHQITLNPVQLLFKYLNKIWQSKIIGIEAIANKIN
ncbi:MAG: hypothetical protein QNJ51_19025 [Calothrix sp. MO_167.B12]|nr:hypothetical protein [Calothrix sp. MO_167.B12]